MKSSWAHFTAHGSRFEYSRSREKAPDPFLETWDVRSKTVDVSLEVEGSEPVVLRSLTAHAHSDAIYREFNRGLVLANPSRKPFTFDLQQLSPGKTYRRIQGVATQDPQTNDGRPVQGHVTLDGRDGLFLLRTE